MRAYWKVGIMSTVFGYFAACSPVQFEKMPDPACGSEGVACVQKCYGTSCIQNYKDVRQVGEGLVDILIVNDNSGSMSPEQQKMGERFPTFLQSLGKLDYHIGMITTDISSTFTSTPAGIKNPRAAKNGNGKFQDGNLLEFAAGVKFLTKATANKENLFLETIKRDETIACENSGYKDEYCPSGDERGIFAANLALDRTGSDAPGFLRPTAHLAIIILADEDERGMSDSRSARDSNDRALISMYPLEELDKPATLVSRFRQRFPDKTLSVHSIIIRPGDTNCLNAQTAQNINGVVNPFIRGTEGYSYAALSELTGGKIGTICDSDYGVQLADIGSYLQYQVVSFPLACRPINDEFKVTDDLGNDVNATADFNKMEVVVDDHLPELTKVTLEYTCSTE